MSHLVTVANLNMRLKGSTNLIMHYRDKPKHKKFTVTIQEIMCYCMTSLCQRHQLHVKKKELVRSWIEKRERERERERERRRRTRLGLCHLSILITTCIAAINSLKPRYPCRFESAIAHTCKIKNKQLSKRVSLFKLRKQKWQMN